MSKWVRYTMYVMVVAALMMLAWRLSPVSQARAQVVPVRIKPPKRYCDAGLPVVEPGGTQADVDAINKDPKDYAWQLFKFISFQADPKQPGCPDPTEASWGNFKENEPVIWESWALASGGSINDTIGNRSEVFLNRGAKPAEWTELAGKRTAKHFEKKLSPGLTGQSFDGMTKRDGHEKLFNPYFDPGIIPTDNQEVRMNRSTYETILYQKLYSQELIQDAIKHPPTVPTDFVNVPDPGNFVKFDNDAKEVKAAWIPITACNSPVNQQECTKQKGRYHWRSLQNSGVWGLAALHVITRDLDKWFWADFIHSDCENNVPGTPCFTENPAHIGTPSGGSTPDDAVGKWRNYILHGTQTEFVVNGKATTLYNPVIEDVHGGTPSCITCHFYASASLEAINPGHAVPQPKTIPPNGGSPQECVLHGNCGPHMPPDNTLQNRLFLQSDFAWSIIKRARSEKEETFPLSKSQAKLGRRSNTRPAKASSD